MLLCLVEIFGVVLFLKLIRLSRVPFLCYVETLTLNKFILYKFDSTHT